MILISSSFKCIWPCDEKCCYFYSEWWFIVCYHSAQKQLIMEIIWLRSKQWCLSLWLRTGFSWNFKTHLIRICSLDGNLWFFTPTHVQQHREDVEDVRRKVIFVLIELFFFLSWFLQLIRSNLRFSSPSARCAFKGLKPPNTAGTQMTRFCLRCATGSDDVSVFRVRQRVVISLYMKTNFTAPGL